MNRRKPIGEGKIADTEGKGYLVGLGNGARLEKSQWRAGHRAPRLQVRLRRTGEGGRERRGGKAHGHHGRRGKAQKEGAGPFDINAHGSADPLGDVPGGQCVIWEHRKAVNGAVTKSVSD